MAGAVETEICRRTRRIADAGQVLHLLESWGLRRVSLQDKRTFDGYFQLAREPLAEYSYAQIYLWRDALDLWWTELHGNLCVFSASEGEFTMFLPPIGQGSADRALAHAFELMDQYNELLYHRIHSRVEYLSCEMLNRLDHRSLQIDLLTHDYIYSSQRMIDLAGADLASKRQARQRFTRRYPHTVEMYEPARHREQSIRLIRLWQDQRSQAGLTADDKRKCAKEAEATIGILDAATRLDLLGLVISVNGEVAGVTMGGPLGTDQFSILVEKTNLQIVGLAQFIFSEFCRRHAADRPLVNVGDDWGIPALARTKLSYRPVKLLPKFVVRRLAAPQVLIPAMPAA